MKKKPLQKIKKILASKPWVKPLAIALVFAIGGLIVLNARAAGPSASIEVCDYDSSLYLQGNAFLGHDHPNTSCGHFVSFGLNPPTNVSSSLQKVAGGIGAPVDVTNSGIAGDKRIFIVSQRGKIHVSNKDGGTGATFLDLSGKVSTGGERGLLGLTFDPNYAQNGYFYVNYTANAGRGTYNGMNIGHGDTVVSRFKVSGDPNKADANSEMIILGIDQPEENHNGGAMKFGKDGNLYISVGDGGGADDRHGQYCWYGNGQCLNTLLGKILRIDVRNASTAQRYKIPAGNPYANGGGKAEIWHYGLRNPWRMSFDKVTGDLFIGDVGQNQWEEISFAANGQGNKNFGWRCFEGNHSFNQDKGNCTHTPPIHEYSHGDGCSVTGGVLYRGKAYPELHGTYIFSDYCKSNIRYLKKDASGNWKRTQTSDVGLGQGITGFGEDIDGEIYIAIQSGNVYKLNVKH